MTQDTPASIDDEEGASGPGLVPAPMSPDAAAEWFADLLEPIALLALERGVRLNGLIDALKLALVRAAISLADDDGRSPATVLRPASPTSQADAAAGRAAFSDSRLAVMTGVHRKDLRRIRTTGGTTRAKSLSIVGEVFARWRSDPRFLTRRGEPRHLLRHRDGGERASFEELVAAVTRDVHPRPVLDEMLRLGMVETDGRVGDRVRLLHAAYVPAADKAELMHLGRDNLADHVAALVGNLQGDGRRFLEQAVYSDDLTEASARQFNLETREVWEKVFTLLMPRLQALYEADRDSRDPRNHRVRVGMYGLVTRNRRTSR